MVEEFLISLTDVIIIGGIIIGIGGTIIGFILRNQKTMNDIKVKTDQHDKCIIRLEGKIDKVASNMNLGIQAITNETRSIRDSTILATQKVDESHEVHKEIRQEMKDQQKFFVDWIQRLENVTRDKPVVSFDSSNNRRLDNIEKVLMRYIQDNENLD